MDYITPIKKMIEFFLKLLMERFYPNYAPPRPILRRQTNNVSFSISNNTKPDGYKNSLSSQYNDDAERMAYVRRARITGL
jgi:hypothetical protein